MKDQGNNFKKLFKKKYNTKFGSAINCIYVIYIIYKLS